MSLSLTRGIASNTNSTKSFNVVEFVIKLEQLPLFHASTEHSILDSEDECKDSNIPSADLSSNDTSPTDSGPISPEKSLTNTPRTTSSEYIYFSELDNSSTGTSPAVSPPSSNNRTSSIVSDTSDIPESLQIFHLEEPKDKAPVAENTIVVTESKAQDVLTKTPITPAAVERVKVEPITISFDKVTRKGEGEYHFANNWLIPKARGYCEGIINHFLFSFLEIVKDPKNSRQLKQKFLDTFKINIGILDRVKKLVDKKPYVLHSDKLANKYTEMRLFNLSKNRQVIYARFNKVGQIACYPKDMLESLFNVISFMKLNQLGHMGLKIVIDEHVMGIFITRDESKNAYIVTTIDPNEGARYKRTVIKDEQIKADFKDSTIFNSLNHRLLQDKLVVIDCLIDNHYKMDNLHSMSLVNQILFKEMPFSVDGARKKQIRIMSDMLLQAVDTNNSQLLQFGINLLKNNEELAENFPVGAIQENGGTLDTCLANIALKLGYEDIAKTLIREFEIPALSLGSTHSYNGDIMRFTIAERRVLDTPLETAIRTKNYNAVELLLDTDEEINRAGFRLNETHKVGGIVYFKKTIERYLRERPELVKSAIIKLSLN